MVYTNNRNGTQLNGIDKDNCPEVTWAEQQIPGVIKSDLMLNVGISNVGCK